MVDRIENLDTDSHIMKTGVLKDLDEANLFDVVVEEDPHVFMDEEEFFDDVSGDSADSVVEFNVSDIVWSRVPSHPWWPGQICDPATSSKKAMKYFKTGRYLIAFFGDHTFAWKEAAMVKPFEEYFSELQKQNKLESFHQAIDCALEEFSRRVQLSLACSCLSEELYSKLQTQTITNAGIRKKFSKRVGGDSFLTPASFDPMKFINIVKEVAMSPAGEVDKLELVRARAQLLAFNRWKGYYELPKFHKHNVVFNDIDRIFDVKNDYQSELMEDLAIDVKHNEATLSGEGNLKFHDNSSGKCKDNSEDIKVTSIKGKNLADSISEKPRRGRKKKLRPEDYAGNELSWHASITKHEVACNDTMNIPITHIESGKTGQTFRVGDRIQKVACKLNESNPMLKHDDGISQNVVRKGRRGRKRKETTELVSGGQTENKPTKANKRRNIALVEASDSEFIKDTYWTDRLIQGIAEDQLSFENQNETVDAHVQTASERVVQSQNETVDAHVQTATEMVVPTGLNSTDKDEPLESVEPESENGVEDPYPTALILTFTDLDSVPSETNLNDIFRKYGPLYESKTEVMKKSRRAKVVFKRTSDAETAFSNTGKCSIFGTALVSYRLKFLPPTKVSLRQTRRCRKEVNLENKLLLDA
ncbi:PWWP domain-containing protein [Cucumis melo var. makuwa]|uniref:PWWP domain-containing protein n=2 Tax=Cucumis melo TaxID=3656 RepID=A0A5D3BXS2_CUCMM|nr:PWWP domain-containing protein [Cucumis melo var. makuwa]TYK03804.1 PWWP domain-containing protein [Cucumis melo var. makuwa]